MQSNHDNTQGKLHELAWHLQIEYSLRGNENQMTGSVAGKLIQAIKDLGVPPTILQRIQASLEKAAWNIKNYNNQAGLALPLYLRLFTQIRQHSHEGWGYFLIERIVNHSLISTGEAYHSIELFLYRERSNQRD